MPPLISIGMIVVDKTAFLESYKNKKLGELSYQKKRSWFPVKSNSLLSGIMADIIGDGHLGSRMVIFSSKNDYEVENFAERISSIFNVKCIIRKVETNPKVKSAIVFDGALVRILNLCGAPKGNKTSSDFDVPMWIKEGPKKVISEFLSHLFDTDGSIVFQNNRRIRIKFKQHKTKTIFRNGCMFMASIRNLLEKFDVKSTNIFYSGSTLRKDGSKTFGMEFEIHGTKNNLNSVLNFKKHIGFNNIEKKKRLERYIEYLAPGLPPYSS